MFETIYTGPAVAAMAQDRWEAELDWAQSDSHMRLATTPGLGLGQLGHARVFGMMQDWHGIQPLR